jgi:hypothetical protein
MCQSAGQDWSLHSLINNDEKARKRERERKKNTNKIEPLTSKSNVRPWESYPET